MIASLQSNAVTFGLWIDILGKSGRCDLVEEFVTSLQRGKFDVAANAQHFATALRALAEKKDVERGRRVYELIANDRTIGLDPYVLNAMLVLYGAEHFDEAKAVFELAVKHKTVSDSRCF